MSQYKLFFKFKKGLILFWLFLLFTGIGLLFWYNEWVFSLPTPVPSNYLDVKVGSYIDINNKIPLNENKPIFIHFYNPKCPCSRFNIPHVQSLIKKYSNKVLFAIVVMSDDKFTVEEIQSKFGSSVPVLFDKSIATSCGVYSTPQAVIFDSAKRLYYRGNYNKSRYCTERNSNYAQMAIDSLLNDNSNPVFTTNALKAYGCELPKCNKP